MNSTPNKRKWFRVQLRTTLLLIAIISVGLATWVNRAHRQRTASRWVEQSRTRYEFDFKFEENGRRKKEAVPPVPSWLIDLLDIHYFAKVVEVNGVDPDDGNLSPLADLVHLRFLTIDTSLGNDDLRYLSRLGDLRSLTFTNPENISDLSPLSRLKQLRYLWLESSQVDDLAPLAGLVHLKLLKITNARFDDLAPLADLNQLERLDLEGNDVSDLTPLAEMTLLTDLDVSRTNVADLTPLKDMKNLVHLNLGQTRVKDVTPIVKLKKLEWLNLQGVEISGQQLEMLTGALPNCRIDP